MKFIKINAWKIGISFLLWIILGSIFSLFCYLSIKKDAIDLLEMQSTIHIMLIVVFTFSMLFFLAHFITAWFNFYEARRLLRDVLPLDIFDDKVYSYEYLYRNIWLIYTKECLFGKIANYPAIVRVEISVAKHSTISLDFTFFIMKLDRFRTQEFSFNFESGQPANIKASIMTFISNLENKGYVLFDISDGQVAADKITLTSA